jgi:hypothetical protein
MQEWEEFDASSGDKCVLQGCPLVIKQHPGLKTYVVNPSGFFYPF